MRTRSGVGLGLCGHFQVWFRVSQDPPRLAIIPSQNPPRLAVISNHAGNLALFGLHWITFSNIHLSLYLFLPDIIMTCNTSYNYHQDYVHVNPII